MNKKVSMNVYLHFLLVIKEMDHFTVTDARDALLKGDNEFIDKTETRKFIYRQLCRNVEKGLIKRTQHFNDNSKKVIYSKTEKLSASVITPMNQTYKSKKQSNLKTHTANLEKNYKVELKKDLIAYEIDLNTTLEEAEEYKSLYVRFPELKNEIQRHQSAAKNKSIKLLGKVNALKNLLGNYLAEDQ